MRTHAAWKSGVLALVGLALCLALPASAFAQPVVKTVPWVTTNPLIPHDTYSGKSIRLKGTTDVLGGSWVYRWDFGDGSPASAELAVTNQYALEASHTYTGPVGTVFTATLTVRNTVSGQTGSANYFVAIRDLNLETRVNIAIDEGLWRLHKQMNRTTTCDALPCGTWFGTTIGTNGTGHYGIDPAIVNAFEVNGHVEDGAASNPYTDTVKRGMRSLLMRLVASAIPASQTNPRGTFNPDHNGNGYGVFVNDSYAYYQGGMFMDALVASGTPARTAEVGQDPSGTNPGIQGRTYASVIQDMVDSYAYCQYDGAIGGLALGGWRYSCNEFPDNSAAQWGAIGIIAALDFGSTVSQIMLLANADWLTYSQDPTTGEFGYTSTFPVWGPYGTTASGMVQLAMDGIGRGNPRWDKAETFIRNNFGNTGGSTVNIKDYSYGLFAFVKAMILHDSNGDGAAEPIQFLQSSTAGVNPIDWYNAEQVGGSSTVNDTNGVARTLVDLQNAAGYWSGMSDQTSEHWPFETPWAILMLHRSLFTAGSPVAVAAATPNPAVVGQVITLDGSGSFHQDAGRQIVQWQWDLDNDGHYDDATGVTTTVSFAALGSYTVGLRVVDDAAAPASDTTTLNIVVSIPPVAPTADANGPYNFCQGGPPYFLDGSGSVNPDEGRSEPGQPPNTIIEYAWDLDGDGQFDDALGAQPNVTANFPTVGSFLIQLRVTDNTAVSFPASGIGNLSDTDSAVVEVRSATDPVCVACITDLTARAKPTKAELRWTPKAGAAGYNIYRGTIAGGPYLKIGEVGAGVGFYLAQNLVNNTTYYFVVRPKQANTLEICQSNEASATPRVR